MPQQHIAILYTQKSNEGFFAQKAVDTYMNWLEKYAAKFDATEDVTIYDADRYGSDRYSITIAKIKTNEGFSVSCEVNCQVVGVRSYTQYWHYDQNEMMLANQTYHNIIKTAKELTGQIQTEKLPMAIIMPQFRAAMHSLDIHHKERSGVPIYNYDLELTKEGDWRKNLYGYKYPSWNTMRNLKDIWNKDEQSRAINTQGTGRNKTVKYRYDS